MSGRDGTWCLALSTADRGRMVPSVGLTGVAVYLYVYLRLGRTV